MESDIWAKHLLRDKIFFLVTAVVLHWFFIGGGVIFTILSVLIAVDA